jgi:dihydrofolate reductase
MSGRLIYDVATSVDGFIADEDGAFDGFLFEGDHVDDYQRRLEGYGTVLMGRATYEAGYAFGMEPGDCPYLHMRHFVFSKTLRLPADSDVQVIRSRDRTLVEQLKRDSGQDIYVSGGGTFAGWLADERLLDQLVLKVNPVVFGAGTPVLNSTRARLRFQDCHRYTSGVVLTRYECA